MLVPEATTHDAVLQAVKQAKPANLEAVELFDVFRGKNVPGRPEEPGLRVHLSARRTQTLTDAEVNAAHEQVVARSSSSCRPSVRE